MRKWGGIAGSFGDTGAGEIFDTYFKGKLDNIKNLKMAGILAEASDTIIYTSPVIKNSYSVGKIISTGVGAAPGSGSTTNYAAGISTAGNEKSDGQLTSKSVFTTMYVDTALSDAASYSAPINTNDGVSGGYFQSSICSTPIKNCRTNSLDAPVTSPLSYFYNMANAPMNTWGSQWTATTTFPTLAPGDPCDSYVVP